MHTSVASSAAGFVRIIVAHTTSAANHASSMPDTAQSDSSFEDADAPAAKRGRIEDGGGAKKQHKHNACHTRCPAVPSPIGVGVDNNANYGTMLACLVADLGKYLKSIGLDHLEEMARLEATNSLDTLLKPATSSGNQEEANAGGKRRRTSSNALPVHRTHGYAGGRRPSDSSYKTTLLKGLEDCINQCKQVRST